MKRWISMVPAALLLTLFLAAPAGACACGGAPPTPPWQDHVWGAAALTVPGAVAGWLSYRALRGRTAK